jgi:pyruvate/2-oxoacid:ferredoxin oxidoreductase alpha subunit
MVGLAKLKVFRPFPTNEVRNLALLAGTIGVFDRSFTFGDGGAMFSEVRSALQGTDATVKDYIGGLGGRDVTANHLEWIFDDLLSVSRQGRQGRSIEWVGLKDGTGRW